MSLRAGTCHEYPGVVGDVHRFRRLRCAGNISVVQTTLTFNVVRRQEGVGGPAELTLDHLTKLFQRTLMNCTR